MLPKNKGRPTLNDVAQKLARKTICFSKCAFMHDTVVGLYINAVEFGIDIHA